jgi:hypothetical protein
MAEDSGRNENGVSNRITQLGEKAIQLLLLLSAAAQPAR